MKAWAGIGIAVFTSIIALVVDPARLFGFESSGLNFAFVGVLLSAAGLAFLLGRDTPETEFSHHIAVWAAGFAVVAILAGNMEVITGTSKVANSVAEAKSSTVAARTRVKKRRSTKILIPDTLKVNRVEGVVTPDWRDQNSLAEADNRVILPNLSAEKGSRLPDDWEPSQELREKFKKFLEAQGLKYDPETAFRRSGTPPRVNDPKGQEAQN